MIFLHNYLPMFFLKGLKILADLIYVEKNISVKDVIIKFDYRKKGQSKLNFKILIILPRTVQHLF